MCEISKIFPKTTHDFMDYPPIRKIVSEQAFRFLILLKKKI